MAASFPVRVYYEDTDAGGVVYYANYLKYAERARTEMLRSVGIDQSDLARAPGILFVVRRVEMDLKRPAKLDDMLDVQTHVKAMEGARIYMHQAICRGEDELVTLEVEVVSVNLLFKPTRLTDDIRRKLSLD